MALLTGLDHPIVVAPMAGGPSTPELVAAASTAGAGGFLAAGYLTPVALRAQITATRAATDRHRFDDDHYDAKLDIVLDEGPAAVSFTFGCPPADVVARFKGAGIRVWVTVTDVDEAGLAASVGADVVVVQGAEAGGHRGSFVDHDDDQLDLFPLLLAVRQTFFSRPDAPRLVAAGGLMTGADVEAALDSGAVAVQLGTAFLLCPEAGTSAVHRTALPRPTPTTLTRAFSGRRARGLVNAWTARVVDAAPSAYPEIHHLTSPLRAHGPSQGDADLVNLWAGEGHARARSLPAAELVAVLAAELARVRG